MKYTYTYEWKYSYLKLFWHVIYMVRERRQLSSGKTIMEGDIVLRQSELSGSTALDAPLANPDQLWPSGVVKFPANKKEIMRNTMEYITRELPCIKI